MNDDISAANPNPLEDMDHWEEFLKVRYPPDGEGPTAAASNGDPPAKRVFRDYEAEARGSVKEFYMVRYHSFYPAHREGAYTHLMNDRDKEMFRWVRKFNRFDLYSKADEPPDVEALRPYYENLIAEFFPATIRWERDIILNARPRCVSTLRA